MRPRPKPRYALTRGGLAMWIVLGWLIVPAGWGVARADWPTYRGDAARTGFTPQTLPEKLSEAWSYDAGAPSPAWPRSGRLSFDRAHHSVIGGGSVFFGTSADHSLYRVDLDTGRGEAIFTADGPIRFAPAIWRDRLFVVSDDGFLYCLDMSGKVLWQHRGGPGDARRLGNGQLISKWPARGAAAIVGDTVYYAAGIWPSDEIFIHAVDCESGKTRWVNDDSGGLELPQPHLGADAESGVSAQGYLVVSGSVPGATTTNVPFEGGDDEAARLLVPTGRAVPAAFDLQSGQFQYFHLQQYGQRGGFATMAVGPMFFNSGIAFDLAGGKAGETLGAGPMAAFPGGLVRSTASEVTAYEWVRQEKADRRGRIEEVWGLQPLWTTKDLDGGSSLIVAGKTVVVGGDSKVTLLDAQTGDVRQSLDVPGVAFGLAVADGRLVVSTDSGQVTAFAASGASDPSPPPNQPQERTIAWDGSGEAEIAAAEEIVEASGITTGYCLDVGCGDGRLAYELAQRTELRIYAVDDDRQNVEQLRSRLRQAGLYGTRITVHHVEDLASLPHPNYFANLIVSGRSLHDHDTGYLAEGWQRALRPYGGTAMFGPSGTMQVMRRGELAHAGQWTHQYMSAANQLCSTDERLQGPLGMLWYRDIDLDLPQRHGRGPAPLFYDGLLYHQGLDEVVCVDAYNGTELWRYAVPGILKAYDGDELMGVSGTGSNYCVGDTGVYVRHEDYCLRIDRRTGALLGKFTAPPRRDDKPPVWGHLALEGDTLVGSLANPEHQVTFRYRATTGDMSSQLTESSAVFAMSAESGELLWRYDAEHSIRHNAIAIGDDQLFLIDRPLATFDRSREAAASEHPTGVLISFDLRTGAEQWRNEEEIDGTILSLSPEYRRLLMSYQPTRFALASESGGTLAVFSTGDGQLNWRKEARYASRPLINAYTVYAQGGAWDLLSGEERPFNFRRSYGCGILAGSRYMMVYRSATLGYFDLLKNERTENYGGMRPGCWLNALPAGGLVLVPDASAGCVCSYLNQAWIALEPVGVRPPEIEPAGGAFHEPVAVRVSHDDRQAVLRYTLDGTGPTIDSPIYDSPIQLDRTSRLRVRAFADNGGLSRASDAEFLIDPDLVPLDEAHWRVWDVSEGRVSSAPSDWSVVGSVVRQRSNIFEGSAIDADPEAPRYGTLRIYEEASDFDDGEIEFEVKSADDDGIGIAFRVQDENRHYLWATDLQRKYRILAVKEGERFRVLAKNDRVYQRNVPQQVRITLDGPNIEVTVDGEVDFSVRDETFARGTIALHSWGSDNVEFSKIRLRRSP